MIQKMVILLLLTTTFLLGCSKESSTPSTFQAHLGSIVNGTKVINDLKNVVAITYHKNVLCTGTLIDEQTVLTAAHCVLPVEVPGKFEDYFKQARVYIGDGEDNVEIEGEYSIKSAATHPLYRNHYKGRNDIAILKLDRAVKNVTPMKILTDINLLKERVQNGEEVQIVGFGHQVNVLGTFGSESIIGSKNKTSMTIQENYANEIILNGDKTGACSGDSGGPALVYNKGIPHLLGVASRVKGECGASDGENYYGLVSDHICWLKNFVDVDFGPISSLCEKLNRSEKRSFIEICEKPSSTQSLTIDALRRTLGNKNCRELDALRSTISDLDLRNQKINDLSILKYFSNLKKINISDNKIESITSLTKLEGLKKVILDGNNIPLEQIDLAHYEVVGKEQQVHNHYKTPFYLACRKGEQASANDQLIVEEVLFKTNTKDCTIAHVMLKDLIDLTLSDLDLDSVKILKDYTNFRMLYLDGNRLTNLEGLENMHELETLYVYDNLLANLDPLVHLSKLNFVHAEGNPLHSLEQFQARENYLILRVDSKNQDLLDQCNSNKFLDCQTQ
ncbi:trypsin-like serine protease [Halobacteriovorax sp. GB3]|uniref:trypsin-like serine protease n=1 Tax=Halobacteriovorax sp. GB3 TaxID=2719615 RepID=UPI00236184AE|nr:trypsin-like serine protease [Halobacteriovorax sp. GB3]MDD0854024.1 trypsin-like serine protease [Halobacteriovorax sp. GB3]